jgi:hypothetical protein
MIDNLFIVESPLQALMAVELNLQFSGQSNGIIYRLSGKGRERNDDQICKVIELCNWDFKEPVKFGIGGGVLWHFNARRYIFKAREKFKNGVRNLFLGEFRAQWMHAIRSVINPGNTVLMDDGAATVTMNRKYLSNNINYPEDIFHNKENFRSKIKNLFFLRLLDFQVLSKPLLTASAFLGDHSDYPIDFSGILGRKKYNPTSPGKNAFFFGSKYSEAGIVSRDYELIFISNVKKYYDNRDLSFIYCAHRDESFEKLDLIKALFNIDIIIPELPAELFLIERAEDVGAISAAYSSVLNNLRFIFPSLLITSFMLDLEEVNEINRRDIEGIYEYFEKNGISVERNFDLANF